MDITKAIREGMEPVNNATMRMSGIKSQPEGTTVTKITASNGDSPTETILSLTIEQDTQTGSHSITISG